MTTFAANGSWSLVIQGRGYCPLTGLVKARIAFSNSVPIRHSSLSEKENVSPFSPIQPLDPIRSPEHSAHTLWTQRRPPLRVPAGAPILPDHAEHPRDYVFPDGRKLYSFFDECDDFVLRQGSQIHRLTGISQSLLNWDAFLRLYHSYNQQASNVCVRGATLRALQSALAPCCTRQEPARRPAHQVKLTVLGGALESAPKGL